MLQIRLEPIWPSSPHADASGGVLEIFYSSPSLENEVVKPESVGRENQAEGTLKVTTTCGYGRGRAYY